MKTILAPVDFSGVCDAVVAVAADLARALDARVVLVTVIQPPSTIVEYAPLLADLPELTATLEKNAERALAKLEAGLKGDGVTTESLHVFGAPIPMIVDQAKALSVDYIVMGSHGHTALYDLLVGSTTHGVLLRAKCPVVIVPAEKSLPRAKSHKVRETVA